MIKIQIKNRFTGKIIFEFSKENNTIKDTVEEAVKNKISLDGASLDGALLDGASLNSASLNRASLDNASLYDASLIGASLNNASLNRASLIGASLFGASLYGASLNNASLIGASLIGASLNNASLDKRYISITRIGSSNRMTTYCFDDDVIWCGCFKGTLQEFENKVNETHKNNELYLKQYLGAINYIKSLK